MLLDAAVKHDEPERALHPLAHRKLVVLQQQLAEELTQLGARLDHRRVTWLHAALEFIGEPALELMRPGEQAAPTIVAMVRTHAHGRPPRDRAAGSHTATPATAR